MPEGRVMCMRAGNVHEGRETFLPHEHEGREICHEGRKIKGRQGTWACHLENC